MKIYWVTTEDHAEDWFVVATCSEEAAKLHEDMEGYNPGDAKAEEIVDIPESVPVEVGWPSDDVLSAVGAKFIADGLARIVEIDGRKFCEGLMEETLRSLEDDMLQALGKNRINNTKKTTTH